MIGPTPLICAVTDRRRLTRPPANLPALVLFAAAAARAGIDLLQIRERDLDALTLLSVVRDIVAATHALPTAVVVNDRSDVAIAAGAAGVHLRADSMPTANVRALVGPNFLVGRSVHSVEETRAAGDGLDYLVCGTLFPTGAKPDVSPLGVAGLSDVVVVGSAPVIAIGGIQLANAAAAARAGAAGVAAIGLFADAWNVADDRLGEVVAALRESFRSHVFVPFPASC